MCGEWNALCTAIRRPFASSPPLISENHAGEAPTRPDPPAASTAPAPALPVSCDRMTASASAPSPPKVLRPNWPAWAQPVHHYFLRRYAQNIGEALRATPADALAWAQMVGGSIAAHVGHGNKRSDRRMLDIRLLIRSRDCFASLPQCSLHFGRIPFAFIGSAPRVRAHRLGEVLASRKSGPATPFGACGDRPQRAHGLPLIGRDYGYQVALPHYLARSGIVSYRLRPLRSESSPWSAAAPCERAAFPGSVTSQLHCVWPVTLSREPGMG